MKNLKEQIKKLLIEFPEFRDNDFELLSHFWKQEMYDKNISGNFSVWAFFDSFRDGYYTSPETIRRARQLLQAKHPELRGKNYKKRQKRGKDLKNQFASGMFVEV